MIDGINSRLDVIKERISDLKARSDEFTQHITHRDKRAKMEWSLICVDTRMSISRIPLR